MANSGSSREQGPDPWSWGSVVKFCSDYIPVMQGNTNTAAPIHGNLTIDEARQKQDAALRMLRLHRYKIPEDGNCMFRAVASQLRLDQDRIHPILREAASDWADLHVEDLLASLLVDGVDEVRQMRLLGSWPGLAALVALANVLGINIAVVQGGDTGGVDIQHIAPFETDDKCFDCGIVLSYLYCGHYDAASYRDYMRNPEYAKWQEQNKRRDEASEQLAKRLADDDASEKLARQLVEKEPCSQELSDNRPTRPNAASGHNSRNGNITRPVSHSACSSIKYIQVTTARSKSFCSYEDSENNLSDTKLSSCPGVSNESTKSTDRRQIGQNQAQTSAHTSRRSTRRHDSDEFDLHHIVRPICNDRDVASILDRNRWLK